MYMWSGNLYSTYLLWLFQLSGWLAPACLKNQSTEKHFSPVQPRSLFEASYSRVRSDKTFRSNARRLQKESSSHHYVSLYFKYSYIIDLQLMTWYTPSHWHTEEWISFSTILSSLVSLFLAYFSFSSSHITEEIPSPGCLLSAWRNLSETVTDDSCVTASTPHLSTDIPIGCSVSGACWDLFDSSLTISLRASITITKSALLLSGEVEKRQWKQRFNRCIHLAYAAYTPPHHHQKESNAFTLLKLH